MAAQKGKDLLLKIDRSGSNNFTTVAGMRTRRLTFNTETVDVTDFESANRWRHLLGGAGVQRASIGGTGIFKDAQSDEDLRVVFFNSEIVSWQIIIPDFGTIEGPFQITSLEYAGEHNGEVSFEMALESGGELIFSAAA